MYFEYINKEIDELLDILPTLSMPMSKSGYEFSITLLDLIKRMKEKQDWLEKELDKLNNKGEN